MMSAPELSVLVVTHNAWKYTERALSALYANTAGRVKSRDVVKSRSSFSSVLGFAAQAAMSSTSFSSLVSGFSSGGGVKRVLIDFWEM